MNHDDLSSVKLFGVCLKPSPVPSPVPSHPTPRMRKCFSMGNLAFPDRWDFRGGSIPSASSLAEPESLSPSAPSGYLSDGLVLSSPDRLRERKKGVPWTEDEHRMFLIGLEKLGRGDWRGISKGYVMSRTPAQVASHAQKYFIRQQSNLNKRRRRSSLFDIISDSSSCSALNRSDESGHVSERPVTSSAMELCAETMRQTATAQGAPVAMNLSLGFQHPLQHDSAIAKPYPHSLPIGNQTETHVLSLSASCSSLSSLCRIDETMELSSLNLSIAPPCSPPPPAPTKEHHSFSAKRGMRTSSPSLIPSDSATEAAMASSNTTTSLPNAIISVV